MNGYFYPSSVFSVDFTGWTSLIKLSALNWVFIHRGFMSHHNWRLWSLLYRFCRSEVSLLPYVYMPVWTSESLTEMRSGSSLTRVLLWRRCERDRRNFAIFHGRTKQWSSHIGFVVMRTSQQSDTELNGSYCDFWTFVTIGNIQLSRVCQRSCKTFHPNNSQKAQIWIQSWFPSDCGCILSLNG